ncbi:hypothetical protein IscW_ISCW007108 [Ixodes scapularis]|uniref:Uncharacterized protein n=1 Tax=Ixodes scapularis TaxID=6945 RepID=B7PWW5_IXOSC|nr:hypothetical protein IscW_ISCW007108 [Ixodes scapularis]|eukprot:XP_002410360.1 hypothetical protein IscW_ISCW007108 [Ixodes scapularis]
MVAFPVVYPATGGRVVLVPPRMVYYYYAYPAVLRPVVPVGPAILNVPVYVNVQPVAVPGPAPGTGVLVGSGVQVTASGVPGTYGYGTGRVPDTASDGNYGLSRSPRYG